MKTRHTPKIGGRSFALLFNYAALSELEDALEGFDLGEITTFVRNSKAFPVMLAALARQGEEEEGRTLDVDAAWFAKHMRPNVLHIGKIQLAVNLALTDGMMMETEDEEVGEVDVVMEQLKKKETPGASPAASSPPTA